MKVKERGYEVQVQCVMCREDQSLLVNREDWDMYMSPVRPHIQVIFPYLSPAEREMLISGICPKCWAKVFPPENDFEDDEDVFDFEEDVDCIFD